MKKTLYLECYSGISGDMTIGALLDLGADRDHLQQTLDSLSVGGYHLHFGRTQKSGIDAYDFSVHLEEVGNQPQGQSHGMSLSGHGHKGKEHSHAHPHNSVQGQGSQHHVHRHLSDIEALIDGMKATEQVKQLSTKIFHIVAEAEAAVHGLPIQEVHFHEVGAIDSIVDILGTAICIDNLAIDQVIVSPLREGQGFVRCEHGLMPVPAPATARILAEHGLKLQLTDNQGEMVTPTGAAIAAALDSGKSLPTHYRIQKIGMGAGKKDFKQANILRAMLIEEVDVQEQGEAGLDKTESDQMWKLESNLDDCSGEALGFTLERLMEAGAADAWYTPIYMKKNRPAYTLQVLCGEEKRAELEHLIFFHTTTVGIRRVKMERTILKREMRQVETPYGPVSVKVCDHGSAQYVYPEYEDLRQICLEHQKNYQEVYQEVLRCSKER
ncbi:nickel pincer cofactor biosynthesis protein LarC [Aminipila butyrica]|uniref:Pyridinium-3,5-bisthiocarboxylic acid mononucleotide nickel insertion protein n=1 Tax=Aminipila butyrica TaxID=433296 RepID=A0A858BSG9_9FIRM|nr:nickel pincer cofactor biosynthesis protein LarC [Aminipila butyrica]QIB68527.1 nickel pincer cofactor biosynthesis protein LarC [Aminipila butyrica]